MTAWLMLRVHVCGGPDNPSNSCYTFMHTNENTSFI